MKRRLYVYSEPSHILEGALHVVPKGVRWKQTMTLPKGPADLAKNFVQNLFPPLLEVLSLNYLLTLGHIVIAPTILRNKVICRQKLHHLVRSIVNGSPNEDISTVSELAIEPGSANQHFQD